MKTNPQAEGGWEAIARTPEGPLRTRRHKFKSWEPVESEDATDLTAPGPWHPLHPPTVPTPPAMPTVLLHPLCPLHLLYPLCPLCPLHPLCPLCLLYLQCPLSPLHPLCPLRPLCPLHEHALLSQPVGVTCNEAAATLLTPVSSSPSRLSPTPAGS